eukprot:180500-Pleurochrysis_carterae.AAC.1
MEWTRSKLSRTYPYTESDLDNLICQQWRKFKALQHEHAWLHWFKYYPLAYLLWLEVVVLPLSAALAAVKLASDDMSE